MHGNIVLTNSKPYRYTTIVEPSGLIVSLEEVKQQLNIIGTSEDTLLTVYINSAHKIIEQYTRVDYLIRTYQTLRDYFDWDTPYAGYKTDSKNFLLTKSEIISLTEIEYLVDGVWTVLDPSIYYSITTSDGYMRILLVQDESYPTDKDESLQSIRIEFTAGVDEVPYDIKLAATMLVTNMYADRGDCNSTGSLIESSPAVKTILSQHRIFRI